MTVTASIMELAPALATRMMNRAAAPRAGWRAEATDRSPRGQRLTIPAGAEETDESLALRTAGGDPRAFAEIVRRHGARLRILALRFTGGTAEADDIVQETFLSYWKTARRWQPGGAPLGAYLTRIAVNRAIDADRRRRVRRFFGLEEAREVADPAPLADAQDETARAVEAVARDIAVLPARQRAAILLASDGDKSNADIAAAMSLSEGAVEQLLVRARRTLRLRLAEREAPVGETGR